jgi:hypothetical protein
MTALSLHTLCHIADSWPRMQLLINKKNDPALQPYLANKTSQDIPYSNYFNMIDSLAELKKLVKAADSGDEKSKEYLAGLVLYCPTFVKASLNVLEVVKQRVIRSFADRSSVVEASLNMQIQRVRESLKIDASDPVASMLGDVVAICLLDLLLCQASAAACGEDMIDRKFWSRMAARSQSRFDKAIRSLMLYRGEPAASRARIRRSPPNGTPAPKIKRKP